ncbi:aromatic hydrocarbon degradation protein [Aureimonas endophytica]|uniref:Aromatic hydrocarbon degradation protein n=2 Tax=Aureimonas endophytica TaxID=2027858 RepID=A0A916ZSR3_9HYPH|nr:aromatic hydrocarbon degradation protein [Aureimonas endophytica]
MVLAAGVMALASAEAAEAGGFLLREQSTIGMGQAFAGAAAGEAGLGSMYWNPATLTGNPGAQVEAGVAGLFPFADVTPATGTSPLLLRFGGSAASGDIVGDAALPSGYASYQLSDRLFVGLAANSPFGLSTSYPDDYAGQIYARASEVRSFDLNPNAALAVNDWLSLGVGIRAVYFKTELSQAVSPLPGAPSAKLDGDDWGIGMTAGLTLKPMEGTEIGVGFRSSVAETLRGSLALGGPVGRLPAGAYAVEAALDLPEQVTVGLHQALAPDLGLNAGFEWTNWSRLGSVPAVGTSGPTRGLTLTELPFRYKDGYYASVGADYRWNDALTVRAGAGYEWSPIDTSNRDLRLPDSDRVHLNVGLGYRWTENLSVDLAYSHIFTVGDGDVELTAGNPHYVTGLPFVGNVEARVDTVSAGLTYRFDAEGKTARRF